MTLLPECVAYAMIIDPVIYDETAPREAVAESEFVKVNPKPLNPNPKVIYDETAPREAVAESEFSRWTL